MRKPRKDLFDIPKGMKFEDYYALHKNDFHPQLQETIERKMEVLKWWYDMYLPITEDLEPVLAELALKQFPQFEKAIENADMKKYIAGIHEEIAGKIAANIYRNTVVAMREKWDLKAKYPKLEEWRDFYCKPQKPYEMDDSTRKWSAWLSDEQWEEFKKLENRRAARFEEWEKERQNEFMGVVQPVLFYHLPELNEIEGDYFISFAVDLRDYYENWKSWLEHAETVIENEMPYETVFIFKEEFQELYHPYHLKNFRRLSIERNKKIYGELYEELKRTDAFDPPKGWKPSPADLAKMSA
jgi:hypothetical protein